MAIKPFQLVKPERFNLMLGMPSPRLVASRPGRLRFGPTPAWAVEQSVVELAKVPALLSWRGQFELDHTASVMRLHAQATKRLGRSHQMLENRHLPHDRRALTLTRGALDTEVVQNETLLALYLPAALAACDACATEYGNANGAERAARWLRVSATLAWHFGDLAAAEARLRLTINALGTDAPQRFPARLPPLVESRGDVRFERGNIFGALEDYALARQLYADAEHSVLPKIALLELYSRGQLTRTVPTDSRSGQLIANALDYRHMQQRATEATQPLKAWWDYFDDLQEKGASGGTLYVRITAPQYDNIAQLIEHGQQQRPGRYSANTLMRLLIVREHRRMEVLEWPQDDTPLLNLSGEAQARIKDKSRGEQTIYIRLKESEAEQWKKLLAHYERATNQRISAAKLIRQLLARAVEEMEA